MAFLDIALPLLIIGGLILAVWAAVSKQTVGEVLQDISDFISDKKNDGEEAVVGIYDR